MRGAARWSGCPEVAIRVRYLLDTMVLDICAACGEEHEPPRGNKCKRTKLGKRIKSELSSGDEAAAGAGAVAGPDHVVCTVASAMRDGSAAGVSEAYEEDEEERDLRRQLAAKECEKRKILLRAALDDKSEKAEKPGKSSKGKERAKEKAKSPKTPKEKTKAKEGKDETDTEQAASEKKVAKTADSDDGDSSDSPSDSSSSSESSSDSDSDDKRSRSKRRRRKRSKFSLYKYTPDDKRLKKCTFIELIYAALCWVLKRGERVGMEYKDLKGYVGHIAYMCMHASMNNYTDRAFRCYDKAIREKAKDKGLRAFRMGNTALSLVHFNLNNIRGSKEVRKPARQAFSGRNYSMPSKVCYSYNYSRDGCTSKRCDYEHRCIVCKASDHTVNTCKQKRY